MPILIGSFYAVSAGLILYADAQGLIEEEARLLVIMIWASVGLLLAVIALILRRSDQQNG